MDRPLAIGLLRVPACLIHHRLFGTCRPERNLPKGGDLKLKNLLASIGVRLRPRTYDYTVETFNLATEGAVQFALWNHPKCRVGEIRQDSIDELRRYLRPGDAVIDIGAHTGETSVLYALAVGKEGRVFAVEPNRYVLPILKKNAALNSNMAPIKILPYAATEQKATLTFNYSDPGYCNGGDLQQFGSLKHGHLYPLKVEGRNVLSELRRSSPEWLARIRLIKTDTEGSDHAVVKTLRELIVATRPLLLCEVYKWATLEQRKAFYRFVTEELGYDCFGAKPYAQLKGEPIGPDDLMKQHHFDIFCIPR